MRILTVLIQEIVLRAERAYIAVLDRNISIFGKLSDSIEILIDEPFQIPLVKDLKALIESRLRCPVIAVNIEILVSYLRIVHRIEQRLAA